MRRVLFDASGWARYYLTGAGVLYTRGDRPVAVVVERQLLDPAGRHLGWFDGWFLRDEDGAVLAFVKGARAPAGFTLPPPRRLDFEPAPVAAPFHPILAPRTEPEPVWRWSERDPVGAADERLA